MLVAGSNVLIPNVDDPGENPRRGFFVWRFVEAADADSASRAALDAVGRDAKLLASLVNPPDDPPGFSVDEIQEVATPGGVEPRASGYIFFPDDEDA